MQTTHPTQHMINEGHPKLRTPLLVPAIHHLPTWRVREIVRKQAGMPISEERLRMAYGLSPEHAKAIDDAAQKLRSLEPVEGCSEA